MEELLVPMMNTKTYSVPTARLRDFLDQPVDMLKIDIEGAETEVILDCRDLLHNVNSIFVEYHSFADQEQRLPLLLDILKENGFRFHIHAPFLLSPSPLKKINLHNGMDVFLNIYGYRNNI